MARQAGCVLCLATEMWQLHSDGRKGKGAWGRIGAGVQQVCLRVCLQVRATDATGGQVSCIKSCKRSEGGKVGGIKFGK